MKLNWLEDEKYSITLMNEMCSKFMFTSLKIHKWQSNVKQEELISGVKTSFECTHKKLRVDFSIYELIIDGQDVTKHIHRKISYKIYLKL